MKFELLSIRSIHQRYDLILFIILYPITLIPSVILISQNWVPEVIDEPTNGTFAFIVDHLNVEKLEPHTLKVILPFVIAGIHLLIFLVSHWSIRFRKALMYKKANKDNSTHVLFYPKNRGFPEILEIQKNEKDNSKYVIFQQKKLEFVNGEFKALKYPNDYKIKDYLDKKGLKTDEAKKELEYYGENSFKIPVPSFMELMKEHVLAPFFVFQLFSYACWMFDEYFIYPLFSMASLFFVEANTVRTRQSNLLELRGVETSSISVEVYRDEEWKTISSFKLVPGDIVFLRRPGITCPADILILSGRCVANEAMLTGESTPQVKESITNLPLEHQFNIKSDKRHVLFAGTKIEQVVPAPQNFIFKSSDEGCMGYVISTGLGSSQGKLIRTILFASQRIAVESKGSIQLLMFLTIFAIMASAYVIYYGIKSTTISTFRIIVEVLLIITSTIPPDLPIELTLSVNSSLLALSKLLVFCTEPFRIPYAGSISVCCFDKTGTLTKEEYQFAGIDEMNGNEHKDENLNIVGCLEKDPSKISETSMLVIGSCHSLVKGQLGQLIGDSLEAAGFEGLSFKLTANGKSKYKNMNINTKKIFHFSSELRRMSTIANIVGSQKTYVLTKGAPEAIAKLLKEVPENYFETYRKYTKQGCRVLALGYRQVTESNIMDLSRESVEKDLIFTGFSIFSAPLKQGTEDTIVELLKSTHRIIILTGDDPLTACNVASKIHIMVKPPIIYDDTIRDEYGNEVHGDFDKYSPCYTEKGLDSLSDDEFTEVVKKCNVFARMSPQSKANILMKLKDLGERTLMCGDGTNDVGALKQADVGVGLVENSLDYETPSYDDLEYKPKLGAASIAAPFVSKRPTISACIDLIRFGRATLSSTIDLFKQLSLNCLISAYSVSVLFIENVKMGDKQLTIFSMTLSIATLALTFAKPLRNLSSERPFESQFNLYLVVSVLLQFIVHFCCFIFVKRMVYETGYVKAQFNYKVKFEPSLMNTAMFILSSSMQVTTYICNFRGRPFMQSIFENKVLFYSVIISLLLICVMFMDLDPIILEMLELVPYPSKEFKYKLAITCFIDLVLCYVFEKISLFIFTAKDKIKTKGLVEPEVIEKIKDYKKHNDDILSEERHKFGLIEMFKQNIKLQKDMILRQKREKELQMQIMKANKKKVRK